MDRNSNSNDNFNNKNILSSHVESKDYKFEPIEVEHCTGKASESPVVSSFDNWNRKFDDLTNSNCKNNTNNNRISSFGNCNKFADSSISATNRIDVDLDLVDDGLDTGSEQSKLHISNGEYYSANRQIIVRRKRKVIKSATEAIKATKTTINDPQPQSTTTTVPPKRRLSIKDILVLCLRYILIQVTRKFATFTGKTDNSNQKTASKMGFLRSMKLKERIVMSFAASLVLFTLFLVIDVQMDFGVTTKHLLPSATHDRVRYVQQDENAGFMRDFKRKFLQKR